MVSGGGKEQKGDADGTGEAGDRRAAAGTGDRARRRS
jgi:hypothetical protein